MQAVSVWAADTCMRTVGILHYGVFDLLAPSSFLLLLPKQQGIDAAPLGETKSTRVVLRETAKLMKDKSV